MSSQTLVSLLPPAVEQVQCWLMESGNSTQAFWTELGFPLTNTPGGEPDAVQSAWTNYLRKWFRLKGIRDSSTRYDLAQDTLAILCLKGETLLLQASENQVSPQKYAMGLANNVLLRYWAGLSHQPVDLESAEEPESSPPDIEASIDVQEQLGRLSSEDQQLLLDFVVRGYTLKEIASKLRATHSAVRKRYQRIRDTLSQSPRWKAISGVRS